MELISISIIIPTYNRKRTFARILKSLEGQSLSASSFEVITVDDGSTDGTLELLKTYAGPLNLIISQTGLPPGEYGYHKALNIGISLSQGTYLLFMDSDMIPRLDALEKLLEAHKRWESRGEKVAIRAWWVRRRNPIKMWLSGTSLSRYNWQSALKRDKKFKKLYSRRENLRPTDAPAAFLSVKREYALTVDGFPGHARCYGMDYEFQHRLKEHRGVRIVFEPEIYAIHGPLKGDAVADEYRWTRGLRDRYITKKWQGIRAQQKGLRD